MAKAKKVLKVKRLSKKTLKALSGGWSFTWPDSLNGDPIGRTYRAVAADSTTGAAGAKVVNCTGPESKKFIADMEKEFAAGVEKTARQDAAKNHGKAGKGAH
jgi:hypothetical protein